MAYTLLNYKVLGQERHGLQPDMHTFTALIGGCAYARQAGLAHQLVGGSALHITMLFSKSKCNLCKC